jgi:hypothetical protein
MKVTAVQGEYLATKKLTKTLYSLGFCLVHLLGAPAGT